MRGACVKTLAALAVVLAGCAGATEEPVAPEEPEPDNDLPDELRYEPGYRSKTGGFVNGTDAAFYCEQVANSTVEVDVNKTFDGGAHSHDLWGGADDKVVFEGKVDKFASGDWFEMPGAVVILGASRATFTLEWDQRPGGFDYRYLGVNVPGIDIESEDRYVDYVLKFTEPGQSHSINFTFEQNDRAHAERTTWSFKMIPANQLTETVGSDGAAGLVTARAFGSDRVAKVTWELHRGYDCLPVDPPHYDHWNGTTSRIVLDRTTSHSTTQAVAIAGAFYGVGQLDDIVPPGTATVVATIEWDASEPFVGKLGLEYMTADTKKGSTTAHWRQPPATTEESNKRTYILDVHPVEADSPYAEVSGWNFDWFFDELGVDDVDNVGRFVGDIHWHVEAFKSGYGP